MASFLSHPSWQRIVLAKSPTDGLVIAIVGPVEINFKGCLGPWAPCRRTQANPTKQVRATDVTHLEFIDKDLSINGPCILARGELHEAKSANFLDARMGYSFKTQDLCNQHFATSRAESPDIDPFKHRSVFETNGVLSPTEIIVSQQDRGAPLARSAPYKPSASFELGIDNKEFDYGNQGRSYEGY
ncbi:uncharacterized protein [Drosophila pseudoobscura]|uniref:DUF4744 domain-containing protein n=1 Tax=Drosophila pseudoobscura pseudoobscura TaxID=46245 RepID=A0A6I8W6L4_DROPS|nr:uncharacterized protein LOC117184617 [Drosophila pseudoobscura]